MKYLVSWVLKNGDKVANQLYTADGISKRLKELESWGVQEITIHSITNAEAERLCRSCQI